MEKSVRQIELPIVRKVIKKAGLYVASEKDLDRLAGVAADAYMDYPLLNWFTNGEYDIEASRLIMKTSLRTKLKDALIYADSEEINGFAVWLPFGFTGEKTIPFLTNGGLEILFHSGLSIIGKLQTYEKMAMDIKKEITNNFDWYLYNLSVRPEAQGKGIASKLMRPMLDFCDKEQMVAYLETNKENNVGMYEHFGFELKKKEIVPKSNVMHYAMIRKPCDKVL